MDTSLPIIQQTALEILIVIDTVSIKSKYSDLDIDIAKPIKIKRDNWFVVCQKQNGDSGINSLHAVSVDPKCTNKMIISGISIDGNSSDAIILNQIPNYKSLKKSIVHFKPVCLSIKTVSNNENSEDGLPATNTNQNVIWFESIVSHPGKCKIKIYFSLYYLNSDGNQQDLYGRFWFPLEININNGD
ncbi:AidA/PixA family protein [Flavobacterium limi]|uniref:Inclusion body protein n=1 Tax=Flavobacterium limi TaxID=2045105 RepID=A0ABQ1U092_9FLAO|nr:AidA/PixA family protein [Flavobacterium limi]GGF07299.1 hypothetical protein GCM10011518_15680 [Flavobacterium limi]